MRLFNNLTAWIGIGVYIALILQMLRVWIAPQADDIELILTLAVMMGFEFIMVHSGIFMAVMPRKLSLFLFIPFCGIFALTMNALLPNNYILWLYGSIIFTRIRFAFSNPDQETINRSISMSIKAAILYFVLIMSFSFGSGLIPEFGLTQDFLTQSGYWDIVKTGGLFPEKPYVPIAIGVVYFSLIALIEVKTFNLLPNKRRYFR